MKITVRLPREINVTHVIVDVPVNYGEEEMPSDFPLRRRFMASDTWRANINIDTGKIEDWPADAGARELYLTVKDSGTYTLLGSDPLFKCVLQQAKIEQAYVPHGLIPGKYGDVIELKIAADGTITNWPKHPDLDEFFGDTED